MSDTRERIRRVAFELFVSRGYHGTTVADIERSAGLAPRAGGFYRHFPSKAALVAEIGERYVIETRAELGFAGVLPLGDTRAELILIAKGYRNAAERQAPLAQLIAEVADVPEVRELVNRVDQDLLEALERWLHTKPFAASRTRPELLGLLMTVLGGWLFFLSKRESPSIREELNDDVMLGRWADFWARTLDSPD